MSLKMSGFFLDELLTKIQSLSGFVNTAKVCYDRFKRCEAEFSTHFCMSPNSNLTFYIWARRRATKILNGAGEGENEATKHVQCSTRFLRKIMLKDLFNNWNQLSQIPE